MKFLSSFKSRLIWSYFLLTSVILTATLSILFMHVLSKQDRQFRADLKRMAELAATYLKGEEVLRVSLGPECRKDPDYKALSQNLQKITRIDSRIEDAYVMIPSGREKVFMFVANADTASTPIACGQPFDATDYPEMANAMLTAGVDKTITSDQWGRWLSGYAPVRDSKGAAIGILGLDIAETTVQALGRDFLYCFWLALAMALLLAMIAGLLTSQWLTKPLDRLVEGMERVREGDLDYVLKKMSQDEFAKIANIFNSMTLSLKTIMRQLAKTVKERERMNRELELAADIQKSTLPSKPAPQVSMDIAGKSLPAKEVGGDYFDFLTPEGERVGFVIADAAGKGFSGSLFMTNSRSIFRVISSQEIDPSKALNRTNDFISVDKASGKGLFITLLYSVFEKSTKRLTFSNAGHYPPLIYNETDKKFKTAGSGGIPLGLYPNQEYPEETIQLACKDVVVMYTDGVIEAFGPGGEMYGIGRLVSVIEENASESAERIIELVEASVKQFIGDAPLSDDMTLIVFKVK